MCLASLKTSFSPRFFDVCKVAERLGKNDECQSSAGSNGNVKYFGYKIRIKIIHEIITDVTQYYLPLCNTIFYASWTSYPAFPDLGNRMILDYSLVIAVKFFLHITPASSTDKSKI